MARHPGNHELTRWLDGEAPELDEHLAECERCAGTLDTLEPTDADLRPALLTVLRPPDDLEARIAERLAERIQRRHDLELFGSLLGIGIETGRLVFDGEENE